MLPSAKTQPPEADVALLLPPKTAVALTELERTEKKMLEKIAVCGREIVTWTAGSVPPRNGRLSRSRSHWPG